MHLCVQTLQLSMQLTRFFRTIFYAFSNFFTLAAVSKLFFSESAIRFLYAFRFSLFIWEIFMCKRVAQSSTYVHRKYLKFTILC